MKRSDDQVEADVELRRARRRRPRSRIHRATASPGRDAVGPTIKDAAASRRQADGDAEEDQDRQVFGQQRFDRSNPSHGGATLAPSKPRPPATAGERKPGPNGARDIGPEPAERPKLAVNCDGAGELEAARSGDRERSTNRPAMAGATGLEPGTSCVTGRRSNQLSYLRSAGNRAPSMYGVAARNSAPLSGRGVKRDPAAEPQLVVCESSDLRPAGSARQPLASRAKAGGR